MAGEDIKDFTVMKFNKKLREEEKRDFNKNFISGNTDYEEKIDLRVSAFCRGAFTSMRLVSRSDGGGWLLCRF